MNIPTMLTSGRIICIPFFVFFFYWPSPWGRILAGSIFVLAALTDWLDGYLARNWAQTTKFGAFLDPVADKLLVVTALILVVGDIHAHYQAQYLAIPAAIIIGREISICALREWMTQLGKRGRMNIVFIAQVKTFMQLCALTILIFYESEYPKILLHIGCFLLYVSAALTLWSMGVYLMRVIKETPMHDT